MSDEKAGAAAMLRTISRDSVLNDAGKLRNPLEVDPAELITLTVNQGGMEEAQDNLNQWLQQHMGLLDESGMASDRDYQRLYYTWTYFLGRIRSPANAMQTELGILSQRVDPSFGRKTYTWDNFIERKTLQACFDTKYGHEVNLIGATGKGKTYQEVLFGQEWVKLSKKHHVVHNINGLIAPADKAGQWHSVRTMSGMLRALARTLSEDNAAQVMVIFDEPGQTIPSQSGESPEVRAWNRFRPYLRKLHATVVYGWQQFGQVFKMLREAGEDPTILRMDKPDKFTLRVSRRVEGVLSIRDYQDVPAMDEGYAYDTEGWTLIDLDVDFSALVKYMRRQGAETMSEVVAAMDEALNDPSVYRKEYQDEVADDKPDPMEAVLPEILEDPTPFLNGKGTFSRDLLYTTYTARGITHSLANALKARLDHLAEQARSDRKAGASPGMAAARLDVPLTFVRAVATRA